MKVLILLLVLLNACSSFETTLVDAVDAPNGSMSSENDSVAPHEDQSTLSSKDETIDLPRDYNEDFSYALPNYAPYWLEDSLAHAVKFWNLVLDKDLLSIASYEDASFKFDYTFVSSLDDITRDRKKSSCLFKSDQPQACLDYIQIPAQDFHENLGPSYLETYVIGSIDAWIGPRQELGFEEFLKRKIVFLNIVYKIGLSLGYSNQVAANCLMNPNLYGNKKICTNDFDQQKSADPS